MSYKGMATLSPSKVGSSRSSSLFSPNPRKARGILLSIFAFLAFMYLFKSYPTSDKRLDDLLSNQYTVNGEGSPRVAKVTMLYGHPNPLYERAVRSHKLHNEIHHYPMHILRHEITGGYWNKPAYLLSLVAQELAKPPGERVEWIMWVDADLILVNPAIPLEIFLPPYDFADRIHFIGNKDHHGLNTGTFFLHVHEWSVRMLTKAMAYPMFRPDTDLGPSMDQEAMKLIFREAEFAPHVLYQPRIWYNTYEFHHGYEGKKGNLLVHFPGLEDDRWKHMNDWLAITETNPRSWELPLEQTTYPEEIKMFYGDLREAQRVIKFADKKIEEGEGVDKEAIFETSSSLRDAMAKDSDRGEVLREAIKELKELVGFQADGP